MAGRDVDQDAASALQVDIFKQGITDGFFSRFDRTIRTAGRAGAHHGLTHRAHDGTYVGKVDVHDARTDDQVGNATNRTLKYVIGLFKRLHQRGVRAQYRQ